MKLVSRASNHYIMNQSVSVICIHRSSKCILQQSANETTIDTTNTTVASSRRCSILVSHFEFLASVFDTIGHLSTTGWCLCSQDNEHKKWHQTYNTSDRLDLQRNATCNLQLTIGVPTPSCSLTKITLGDKTLGGFKDIILSKSFEIALSSLNQFFDLAWGHNNK